jgi:tetratricopeptide (TPR) repeat protein
MVAERHARHRLAGKCHVLAGQCLMRAEDFHQAIEVFRSAVEKTDVYERKLIPEALYWLGDCLTRIKDYEAAHQVFQRLMREYPYVKWAKYGRARLAEEAFTARAPRGAGRSGGEGERRL